MENAPAGWYPNPEPGPRLRYWDGARWTEQARNQVPGFSTANTSNTGMVDETQPAVRARVPQPFTPDDDATAPMMSTPQAVPPPAQPSSPDGRRAPALAVIAFTLTLTLLLVMLALYLNRDDTPVAAPVPSSNATAALERTCWSIANTSPSPAQVPPARVSGGGLSFPRLGSPWGPVTYGTVLSAATDTAGQSFVTHRQNQDFTWVAGATVAEVNLGDPDASPKDAAETMARCLRLTMYGHRDDLVQPKEDVTRSAAATIDGHSAWIRESTLAVDIPRVGFRTAEEFTLVMVQTSPGRLAMYYASVPQGQTAAARQARATVNQLRVN